MPYFPLILTEPLRLTVKRLRYELELSQNELFDRLIAVRESWSFGSDELFWATAATEAGRFLGARRWGRTRRSMVASPMQPRP